MNTEKKEGEEPTPEIITHDRRASSTMAKDRPRQVALERVSDTTPGALLQAMVERGSIDTALLREMLELQKEWEANEARKAYVAAMAECKADPEFPTVIRKNKAADFPSKKEGAESGRVKYRYTTLDKIVPVVSPVLSRHGFSFDWVPSQDPKTKELTVELRITHVKGHIETFTLTASPDQTGAKNAIQAVGSTFEYLKRYTLTGALGISTGDDDDAGSGTKTKASAASPDSSPLPPEVTKALERFSKWFGITQETLQTSLGKPVTEWRTEELSSLSSKWEDIKKACPDSDPDRAAKRRAKARELFGLPPAGKE